MSTNKYYINNFDIMKKFIWKDRQILSFRLKVSRDKIKYMLLDRLNNKYHTKYTIEDTSFSTISDPLILERIIKEYYIWFKELGMNFNVPYSSGKYKKYMSKQNKYKKSIYKNNHRNNHRNNYKNNHKNNKNNKPQQHVMTIEEYLKSIKKETK